MVTDSLHHFYVESLLTGKRRSCYAESATGLVDRFSSLDDIGTQLPEASRSTRSFFDVCCTKMLMVGRAGEPQGSPGPMFRSANPVRSATLFRSGLARNRYNIGITL